MLWHNCLLTNHIETCNKNINFILYTSLKLFILNDETLLYNLNILREECLRLHAIFGSTVERESFLRRLGRVSTDIAGDIERAGFATAIMFPPLEAMT